MADLKLAGTTNNTCTIIHSAIGETASVSLQANGTFESLYTGNAGLDTFVIADDGAGGEGTNLHVEVVQPIEVV